MNKMEGSMLYQGGRIAVIVSRFNATITSQLEVNALAELQSLGVPDNQIDLMKVPGAFELPVIAKHAASSGRYAGILALGAVIQGGTRHFDYVCSECARGLQEVSVTTGIPVAFGVLTTDNQAQAEERASSLGRNKGSSAAMALMETMNLCRLIQNKNN
jgi:6,7-dimethyl-8-ribityllumazine synthase